MLVLTMLFIFLTLVQSAHGIYVISLYGDVYTDVEFFTQTFPWIVDNIGGDISVDYYLLGSGKYSVPQMCALEQLRKNTFLQAQFLKCEAEGTTSATCLCDSGIDPQKYQHCVLTKGSYASLASSKYSQLGLNVSPIIDVGYKNTVFGVEDNWYLKKVCSIFGDNPPRGCIEPFACNSTSEFSRRKGVVSFNCNCSRDYTVTATTPESSYTPNIYD